MTSDRPSSSGSRTVGWHARQTGLAALFFLFAMVISTWPIARHISDGLGDLWDAKFTAWVMHWDYHQTFHDPLKLFHANIFYPARYTLAFSENLYGAALFGFPLYAAGVSTLTAYNVLFLLGMFLSALAAWALARDVTGDPAASVVAGMVFAFVPWRIAQIPHVQYQWGPFLALLLLFLLRYLDHGRRRDAALFGLFFAWNAITNVHYGFFAGMLVAVVLAYEAVAAREGRRRVVKSLLVTAAAGVLVLPFYVPYAKASKLYGMSRGYGEIQAFSGRPIDFLTSGPQNKFYGPLTQRWAQPEGDFFPGLVVVALALTALVLLRGSKAREKREAPVKRMRWVRVLDFAIVGGVVLMLIARIFRPVIGLVSLRSMSHDAVLLSLRSSSRVFVFVSVLVVIRLILAFPRRSVFADLGDFLRRLRIGSRAGLFVVIAALGATIALGTHTPYYRFLVKTFGSIFGAIRVPSRGIVLFDLALGVLAAWGLSLLMRRCASSKARFSLVAAAVLVTGMEYRAFPVDVQPVEKEPARVYRWLAGVSLPGSVIEWPLSTDPDVEHTFRSTAHWKPLVNGYSGFGPPHYHQLAAALSENPIPDSIWKTLSGHKVSILLFHPHEADGQTRKVYVDAVRRGISQGKLEVLGSFPNGASRDYAFRLTTSPRFDARLPARDSRAAAAEVERQLARLLPGSSP